MGNNLLRKIPYPSLILLAFGYACFGWLMGLSQGASLTWAIAWLGSIAWLIDESLTWFAPVAGAIAVILSVGLSAWALVMAIALALGMFVALSFLSWSTRAAFRDSIWIGGITIILITLASWLGVHLRESSPLVAMGQTVFAVVLIAGMVGSGMGAIAWLQMRQHDVHRHYILWIFGSTTAVGLICGGIIGIAMQS
ncbi:MAG: hypothetical protein ACFE0J_03095 [Elainellaceae cyanobacterium]